MIRLLDRHWFLTWTTYGTWLPGDERGFVGPVENEVGEIERHNIPGTPYDKDQPELERYSRSLLKSQPIWLHQEQAETVLEPFLETTRYRGWVLVAASVMSNHCHVVLTVPGDPEPSKLLGDVKSYASRRLTKQWGRPAAETWWTEHGSKRKLRDELAVSMTGRYTLDQQGMLASYVDPGVPPEWMPASE